MPIFTMTELMYELVYDSLSFTLASMMATTLFLWFRVGSIHEKYKAALIISGLVTFIAAYHYIRIFNSWTGAYQYAPVGEMNEDGSYDVVPPQPTGVPFNDAYRYMDWLLTVPLLLMEILLVMKLDAKESFRKSLQLGVSSALMIIVGYPGELILEKSQLGKRWGFWAAAMVPFCYIVYELTVGLAGALNEEEDERIRPASELWEEALRRNQWTAAHPLRGDGLGIRLGTMADPRAERQAAAKAQEDKRAKQLSAFLEREAERKAVAAAAAEAGPDGMMIKFGEVAVADKDVDTDADSESPAATLSSVAATCETEDREARKLQKKLRDIAKLQEREARGERLDSLQLKKIGQKVTIEVAFEWTLARAAAKARIAWA